MQGGSLVYQFWLIGNILIATSKVEKKIVSILNLEISAAKNLANTPPPWFYFTWCYRGGGGVDLKIWLCHQ